MGRAVGSEAEGQETRVPGEELEEQGRAGTSSAGRGAGPERGRGQGPHGLSSAMSL